MSDEVTTICGTGERTFTHGKCLTETGLRRPRAVCMDPLNTDCYWVGDISSIRYCTPEAVTLIAGREQFGFADGIGEAAQFNGVSGLLPVCTGGGDKLYVAEYSGNRIRVVDTKTRAVTTVAGNGKLSNFDGFGSESSILWPRKLVFNRSLTLTHAIGSSAPVSASGPIIFITAHRTIRILMIASGQLTTCPDEDGWGEKVDPYAIDTLPSGQLIVSGLNTRSIYLYDPNTGTNQLIAGHGGGDGGARYGGSVDGSGVTARFDEPADLVVVAHEQCVYLVDSRRNRVRHMTLPAHLFSI